MSQRIAWSLTAACALVACHRRAPDANAPLRVAAAADLARAFDELGKAYAARGGEAPTFTFGSTGLLAKQIEQGAPFDLFAAANVSFADEAIRSGACRADSKALYARGRIVAYASDAAPAPPEDLRELADLRFAKIAIANPEHAPYGRAAQQALERAGVWAAVRPRLVYGENVQQTLQFADSGNADVAIVALSLAASARGHATPIDPSLHDPIDQALVVCARGDERDARARRFAAFVGSAEGRDVLRRHGFLLPGETFVGPAALDRRYH